MKMLDAETIASRLPYDRLVPALKAALGQAWEAPERVHFDLGGDASLLMMPAWNKAWQGVKIVNVFPHNAARGKPAIHNIYILSDGETGEIQALFDAETLTSRRTAAVAALGASFLAPPDADHMLLVGAGRVAQELPAAFAAVRPIKRVSVWARNPARASELADKVAAQGFEAAPVSDLASAVRSAPIIACATFSTEPLIRGEWLGPDTHLSLIGGFRPTMREADSAAVQHCHVVADTRGGVLAEAGDLLTPIAEGLIGPDHVKADLPALCRAGSAIAAPAGQPTLFKTVGHAVQDLIAATLCVGG